MTQYSMKSPIPPCEGPPAVESRQTLNFNSAWGFWRGDLPGAEAVNYDDTSFANITLPHTMRLEKKHCGGGAGTYKGIGWYRRYFTLDKSYRDKKINIDFQGIMTDSEIYLNGEKIYTRNGGYMGFSLDITDLIKLGETNVLAVRVSAADSPDSPPGKAEAHLDFHYYSGIYRDVTLRITDRVYITDALQANKPASGGIFVTYPKVTSTEATVMIKTHVQNDANTPAATHILSRILNGDGVVVAEHQTERRTIAAGEDHSFEDTLTVVNPKLWHPHHPDLYTLSSELYREGTLIDAVTTRIGIRTIRFDGQGFYINGEKLYLRGTNRHQCFQNIGDAASNSMHLRDALQIKHNGFNALRLTQYPHDPEFLDACDEVGLVTIVCQAGWQNFTNTKAFYDNTIRDIREMVRRDRNHPSSVLWETCLNETAYPYQWAKDATTAAHEEYPGDQMYTSADYGFHGELYDVCYKVQSTLWSPDPADWVDYNPNMPFITREWGDFEGPSKARRKDGEAMMNTQTLTRQRYLDGDGYSDWGALDASDRTAGHFLWSWNDYSRGSNINTLGSGTVDIDRYEKYCYYWFMSMQSARNPAYGPVVFIASTYSENSGRTILVYSNCDSVKLWQNGSPVGEITREEALKTVPNIAKKGGSPIFTFALPEFVPGELRAEAFLDGEIICTHTVKTPGAPTRLEVEIRERGVPPIADGSDLIPVYIKALDENGTVVPDFRGKVSLAVTGEGALVGAGIPRIRVETQQLESGIGFAFVRTTHMPGAITVTATSENLADGRATTTSLPYAGTFVLEGEHTPWIGGVEKLEEKTVVYPNIAAHQPVTVSTEQADNGNFARHLTDENDMTCWCASSGRLPQWAQIDLGKRCEISGFGLLWEFPSSVYKYNIQVSDDGKRWETVVDKSDLTTPNGSEELQFAETSGRYVRLNITEIDSGWACLTELRVIPASDKEDPEPGAVLPDDVIASITTSHPTAEGRGTELLRDGVTYIGSGWLSASKELPQTVTIELKEPMTLLGSRIYWEKDSSWYTYTLEVSADGITWAKALEHLTVGGQHYKPEAFEAPMKDVRYVRLTLEAIVASGVNYEVGMAEWILYGNREE